MFGNWMGDVIIRVGGWRLLGLGLKFENENRLQKLRYIVAELKHFMVNPQCQKSKEKR